MKFSIVTSFYNEPEELINDCCQSILSQTYSNFEWVVTDDYSQNENTTKLVKSLPERDKRIRYVEQTKKKEVWWNPQTYAKGDVVVTVDGDDHMFPKVLEIYNYFYNKCPDVICMTTEIRNYKNKTYSGSLYLNYENYDNHLNYLLDIKHDPNIQRHGTNEMFSHGYNRSWRNINGLDFKGDLDNRLIIVDYLQLTKLEEIGKILHIPRALYGYNSRDISISRMSDSFNDKNFRTQEIDQSIIDRRKGKKINSIKRIFDGIFIESNAFLDCGISTESTTKKLTLITPEILSPLKQEMIKELYFDHDIYFNEYRDDVDYCLVQFSSPEQYDSFFPIYENIKKYIGNREVVIQITYKKINQSNNDLFLKFKEFLQVHHFINWFDFDNCYLTIKLY